MADYDKHLLGGAQLAHLISKIKATFVPQTRTINGQSLDTDVSLGAVDVGALPDTTQIPSKTSDLTNDSGFITSSDIPSIPTKTSDLTNDSGFQNATQVASAVATETARAEGVEAAIKSKISTQASSTNKLISSNEMSDAINSVVAYPIYKNASQGNFTTKAELLAATVYYTADGNTRIPTKNDYTYVLADETHNGNLARYVVADTSSTITWAFQVSVSGITFTQEQLNAINSGATKAKIDSIAEIKQVPTDGTTGQVLTKTASGYAWADIDWYDGEVQ